MIRLLALFLCAACQGTYAREVTIESALSAIVAVESGCTRVGMGQISGRWEIGADGEVSPFQLHVDLLRDLGVSGKLARLHRDPVYAESLARFQLDRLYKRFGNWPDTFAAWNGGANGYKRRMARDYSERCMNLATQLAKESAQ